MATFRSNATGWETQVRLRGRPSITSNHWGRHFDTDLPEKSARFLEEVPGSVRRLRVVLSGAFAQAVERKSRLIEIRDLEAVLFAELPLFDLESAEPQGCT